MSIVIIYRGFFCQFAAPWLQVSKLFQTQKPKANDSIFVSASFAFCGQIVIEKIKLKSCKTNAMKIEALLGDGQEKELEHSHLQLWILLLVRFRSKKRLFFPDRTRSTASVRFSVWPLISTSFGL